MSTVTERLNALRSAMKEAGTQWYFMTTADPHGSEYIGDHYKEREFFSGFTGSNGDLLVGQEKALLWTDGRYFVQAEKELAGSGIELMKQGVEGVPTVTAYLKNNAIKGDLLLADGKLISASLGKELRSAMKSAGGSMQIGQNLTYKIWSEHVSTNPVAESNEASEVKTVFGKGPVHSITTTAPKDDTKIVFEKRPADSAEEIRVLPKTLFEQTYEEKLSAIRDRMREKGCNSFILSKLDDQMWLYNIRGKDVLYNPVAYAYSIITLDDATLYIKDEALTGTLCDYSYSVGFSLRTYEEFYNDLAPGKLTGKVMIDTENSNYLTLRLLQKAGYELVEMQNPTESLKAVKQGRELELIRENYLKDSAVLARFLKYLKENAGKESISEVDAQKMLDRMRLEQEGCNDLSFTTISAFGPNGAMMHYKATEEDHAMIGADGVYLVDSGGQYDGGTTDVTRTLILGKVPDQVREHFTRTAIGMLSLQNAIFLKGCTGRNLDILARKPMWDKCMDFKCGTGHGIGYMLNVHEGPQSIRPKKRGLYEESPLEPGMLISDEPGVYIAGEYGIRLENILLVSRCEENDNGIFYCFEPLTLVPIDLDGIDVSLLSPADKEALNSYHKLVYEKLSPLFSEEENNWLRYATRTIV